MSLNATATAGVTEFRWYTTATGGSYVSSPVTGTSTTFTPSISATTNYYVTAYNGSCESQVRTLVVAKVNPTPVVTFTPTTTTVCGEADILQLTASGDKETTHLINENFESGALGVFSNINNDSNGAAVDAITSWKNQTSTFVPTNTNIWFPAISSGFGTNKFAVAYSDSDPVPTNTIENSMALTNAVSTNTFLNLTLKLKLFYSRYFPDGYVDSTADEFVRIELSTDGGTTYPVLLQEFTSDVGIGNKFTEFSYNLSAYLNQSNLKIRIRHRSYAGTGWLPDGIAVDDIELFGERPLNTSFSYDTTAVAAYTNIACTPPYAYVPGTPVATIYIKPTPVQLETASTFTVPVSATLSSGCSATGSVVVTNNTKTWNPATSVTDWATANWKQDTNPPTADKCVIIKKPVVLGASTNGFAKNIKIETASGNTGNLNIAGSLTVTDAINTTAATDLVVESDGNLKQVNESLVNTTPVSVRRLHSLTGLRKEYNYLSSPVSYQNMKAIFGNNPANVPFVTKLNEPTNFFVNAAATDWDGPEDRAKGFAVREPIIGYTGIPAQNLEFNEAQYQGIPNNGNAISLSLDYTPNRGYNLAGNPYPSNLDIVELYANSTTTLIDPTFRFWDNTVNEIYTQMGGAYQGYSYALYNVLTDPAIGYGTNAPGDGSGESSKIPNRVIKVSQAFMVRATGPNAKLNFNNTQRKTTNTNSVFFGKTSPHNRYHLELVKSNGFTVQNGIAYFNGGNQAFGLEDTRVPNSQASDALFSFAGDAKVVINGRSAFTVDDMMPLGLRHFTSGTYKIQVVDEEGVFANGQSIYLKDKQLNILTDLTAGDYTFTSEAGEFTNRFEIVYKPEMVLGTDGIGKSKIEVYRDVQDFVVRSADKTIENIELYDAAGRLVFKKNGKSNEIRFDANRLAEGMYILKVQLKDGEQFTKKIRK